MKKQMIVGTIVAFTLALSTTAFAASPSTAASAKSITPVTVSCTGFIDANKDGVCDNKDDHCTGYTDKNQDGTCDNCLNQKNHNESHSGKGTSHGHRSSHGGGHH